MQRLVGLTLTLVLASSAASAQFPPDRLRNVEVFPADMPVRALIDSMQSFTRALGVRCTYCHVGQEGQPLDTYDFVSDDKPAKLKARTMLAMVDFINNEQLVHVKDRRNPPIAVSCVTCHHGIAEPRTLQQVLLLAYDAGGADSAEAAYRALRQRYFGSAAYNFGEVPLADLAAALRARNRPADAVRFHRLNMEFSPNSAFAHRQAGAMLLATGDTAAAITALERAIAIDPNDQTLKALLQRIKPRH